MLFFVFRLSPLSLAVEQAHFIALSYESASVLMICNGTSNAGLVVAASPPGRDTCGDSRANLMQLPACPRLLYLGTSYQNAWPSPPFARATLFILFVQTPPQ
ncbi:hypothetical protein J2W42_003663 [Rhizobium tibeticum]|nr:hypothetical protein [Rhizobium tibeticum]